jgi:hypothetical protein
MTAGGLDGATPTTAEATAMTVDTGATEATRDAPGEAPDGDAITVPLSAAGRGNVIAATSRVIAPTIRA